MVLWVFGYGSLIWKAGFNYDERVVGYIKGYKRVFYQGSTDHRGTPENPGRTATLEPQDEAICWGAAYRVTGHDNEQLVLSYLDLREKQYDQKIFADIFTDSSSTEPAISGVLVYVASSDKKKNPNYLGPADMKDMARQIASCVGPAGPNHEYIFRLEEALSEIGVLDEELVTLADEIRKTLSLKKRNLI